MHASGSSIANGHLPWPETPAPAQFRPEPAVDTRHKTQNPFAERSFFEHPTEPASVARPDISFGPFRCLPFQFLLLESDKQVSIGSRSLEILIVLLERPGELITKQELMARVWPNVFVEPANLTVNMSALRRTLRDGRDGNRFIINIPGRGYSFVASVGYLSTKAGREAPSLGSPRPQVLHPGVGSCAMQQT
ncbi:winged helix-turn-helix domain-containing protein [Mesorhizobium sp. PL10]